MEDLVSRKSVIDIVMQYCPDDDGTCSKAGHDLREMLDEIENLAAFEVKVDSHEMTNGDKIRGMTNDSELADFLGLKCHCCIYNGDDDACGGHKCKDGVLAWLASESEEDDY